MKSSLPLLAALLIGLFLCCPGSATAPPTSTPTAILPPPTDTPVPPPEETPTPPPVPTDTPIPPMPTDTPVAVATDTPIPVEPTAPPTDTPVPPPPAGQCPGGCTEHLPGCDIKGNISTKTDERIYHVPGQRDYEKTKIDPSKGERWFCTEEEAIAAGWRKAQQ